ncbi:YhjD/YihY/BrkB family envelope integrity protein [Fodinibacter luteus]
MTGSERTHDRVAGLVAWADRNPVPGTILRIARELLAVDVRDRIFGMAGQSFLAVVPLLIIASTWLSESDGESIALVVNERLGLTGPTATTVVLLFTKPEGAAEVATASGLSIVLLFFSVNSYTRTLRRSMERPWGLPAVGWRGQLTGLLGVGLLILMQSTLSVIATGWISETPALVALESLARTLVAMAFWLAIGRALTHGRLPVRHLWPGALIGAIGTSAIALWSVTFLPTIFERDAARYGVIGVALALVTWLLAIAGLFVVVGVAGAQIARATGWIEQRPDPLVQPLLEQPEAPVAEARPPAP